MEKVPEVEVWSVGRPNIVSATRHRTFGRRASMVTFKYLYIIIILYA